MICRKCQTDKSIEEFKGIKRGGYVCKHCQSNRKKEYYQLNKERRAQYQKEYHKRPEVHQRIKEYYKEYNKRYKQGSVSEAVVRDKMLRAKYHITIKEYNILLTKQNGVCAICGKKESRRNQYGAITSLSIDHDHACCPKETSCGKCIRGLLCNDCNQVLGRANDSAEVLQAAIDYLKNHKRGKLKITA